MSTTKPRERKTPHSVQNQLAAKKAAKPADAKEVAKAKRVFKKAGCPDPTDAEVKTYLAKLAKSGQKSSRTVAKEIREGVAEGTERNSKHADRGSTPEPTQARFDPSPTP
jgi:hypothetical protein